MVGLFSAVGQVHHGLGFMTTDSVKINRRHGRGHGHGHGHCAQILFCAFFAFYALGGLFSAIVDVIVLTRARCETHFDGTTVGANHCGMCVQVT